MNRLRAGLMAGLLIESLLAALFIAGCMTYRNVREVHTFAGFVTSVDGGTASQDKPPSWLDRLSELLGSATWLVLAGGVLLLILAWKFPALLRWHKARRSRASESP